MKITIVCVGKLKEKYWKEAIQEYSKRLTKYCKLDIVELPDEKAGERILKAIKQDAFVIALAVEGKMLSSEQLAEQIEKYAIEGISHIVFIIGGSLGLSKEVIAKADKILSFSAMTFPHQMMRVILLEQIYRAMRIIKKEPYHK